MIYLFNMEKRFLYIVGLILMALIALSSCKATKDCCYLEEEMEFVLIDTICFPSIHVHHPDTQECLWLDEEEVVLKDTLKCTILIPQKKEICEKRR
jgi:hypothetical protein